VREHSRSKDDPNPPRHRIAARWRLCRSWKVSVRAARGARGR